MYYVRMYACMCTWISVFLYVCTYVCVDYVHYVHFTEEIGLQVSNGISFKESYMFFSFNVIFSIHAYYIYYGGYLQTGK